MAEFMYRSRILAPSDVVFRWHTRPDALEKLTPSWLPVKIARRSGGIKNGAYVELVLGPRPGWFNMRLEH